MNIISLESAGKAYRASASHAVDISIPLRFNEPQLQAFGAPAASSEVFNLGSFVGAVDQGGSCNCQRYHLTPHCNGTHTECVGHITRQPLSVHGLVQAGLLLAQVITITPKSTDDAQHATNRVISRECLRRQLELHDLQAVTALVVRTLPNTPGKMTRNYEVGSSPAYFEPAALAWLAQQNIEHLLVDVPSVDRMDDGGHLLAHRAFWGLAGGDSDARHAQRPQATITELIYVPDNIADARHLLSLQLAPFVADAAPSRPLLYPLLTS
jgi:kynurenine formamidase